jgi:hypothetical protein
MRVWFDCIERLAAAAGSRGGPQPYHRRGRGIDTAFFSLGLSREASDPICRAAGPHGAEIGQVIGDAMPRRGGVQTQAPVLELGVSDMLTGHNIWFDVPSFLRAISRTRGVEALRRDSQQTRDAKRRRLR